LKPPPFPSPVRWMGPDSDFSIFGLPFWQPLLRVLYIHSARPPLFHPTPSKTGGEAAGPLLQNKPHLVTVPPSPFTKSGIPVHFFRRSSPTLFSLLFLPPYLLWLDCLFTLLGAGLHPPTARRPFFFVTCHDVRYPPFSLFVVPRLSRKFLCGRRRVTFFLLVFP